MTDSESINTENDLKYVSRILIDATQKLAESIASSGDQAADSI